jgi:hypothetical protein
MWGLLRVCAACPAPRLKFELRPSWNNIHVTFPTWTAQDATVHQGHTGFSEKHLRDKIRCFVLTNHVLDLRHISAATYLQVARVIQTRNKIKVTHAQGLKLLRI